MKHVLALFLLLAPSVAARGQRIVAEWPSVKLDSYVPAGNYSGLCPMGTGRYAVVDDKSATDGFWLWRLRLDGRGRVDTLQNLGFRSSGLPNRDGEDICLLPPRGTLLTCGEADNRVREYRPDGQPTGRQSVCLLPDSRSNSGLEGLCWDEGARSVWAAEENNGRDTCRLFRLDTCLRLLSTSRYPLDPPQRSHDGARWYAHGVSAVLSCGQGQLLVLEREAYVPGRKIGARVFHKLFLLDTASMQKRLLWQNATRLNLTARSWANYEGLCWGAEQPDGTRDLFLLSDSQNRYAGVLHDRLQVLRFDPQGGTYAELMTAAQPDRPLQSYSVPGDSNVYSRMLHHGVAFESNKVAFRVYFDHRQNIDLYGKRLARLELAATHFYPTPAQQAAGYGNDVLWAGSRIGCGTLRLWDGQRQTGWTRVARRGQRIVEQTPERVVVEMTDSGCVLPNPLMGAEPYDVTTRYTLLAGHRDLRVDVTLSRPLPADYAFCTGVQNMGTMQFFTVGSKNLLHALATWGTDLPEQSSQQMRERFPAETIGLYVYSTDPVPEISSDGLLLLGRKGQRTFRYHVAFCATKEADGFRSEAEWFDYCQRLTDLLEEAE